MTIKVRLILLCCLLCTSKLCADPMTLNAIGTLLPSAQCNMSAQVTGRVDNVLVDVGDPVKKDQPLVLLETSLLTIELVQKNAALDSAKISLNDAERNFQRMLRLWEKQDGSSPSISQKKFEDSKSAYEQSLVQFTLAEQNQKRAQFNVDETMMRAPFDGVVTKRFIDRGDMVTSIPLTHVLEIQSIDPLYLEFSVSQRYQGNLILGMPIQFSVEGLPERVFEGKIDRIFPAFDKETRSIKCRAVIVNHDDKLRPGSLVKVEVKAL